MKTTMDAVIEFKGELSLAGINKDTSNDDMLVNDSALFEWEPCTVGEFNALVGHLSTNFGRCGISFSEHCSNESVRLQTKPVYTQAMSDAGELPSVGMECLAMVKGVEKWFRFCPDYIGIKHIIGVRFDKEREASFGILGLKFKPLTPPIKLIDGKAYQFDYHKGTFQGYFKLSTGRLYHSTGYYHESVCSNIKPLTVEGE